MGTIFRPTINIASNCRRGSTTRDQSPSQRCHATPGVAGGAAQQFQRLQSLSHPNIVRVHEYDRDGDTAFFDGMSQRIITEATLGRASPGYFEPLRRALIFATWGRPCACSSPRNRSRRSAPEYYITDEGEVRVLGFGGSQTLHRSQAGSQLYASCQRSKARGRICRTMYAFTCVVYLLLTEIFPSGAFGASGAHAGPAADSPHRVDSAAMARAAPGLSFERERRPLMSMISWSPSICARQ